MKIILDRKLMIERILINYNESGVITPAQTDHTRLTLSYLCDNDLLITLLESHNCRENVLAINNN